MPLDPSQVQWDKPTIDPSQVQWDEQKTQEAPSLGSQFLQSAKQAGSGILEGAISLVNLPMETVRAAGEVIGVPRQYLPLSTTEINQRNIEAGITTPEGKDFGSKAVRFTGGVLGSASVTPARSINVTEEAMRKALPSKKIGADVVKEHTLKMAGEAGYSVPKSNVKQTFWTNLGERFGGKQAIEATAQIKNQPVTNKLAAKALGLADDTPLTPEVLSGIRQEAGKAYEAIRNLGTLSADDVYRNSLREIRNKFAGASKDFPELSNPQVGRLVRALSKPTISAEGAIEQVKNLRGAAKSNLMPTSSASDKLLGNAQRKAAEALDDLIERNIEPNLGAEILNNYKAARQLIAKTYTVEQALNPATGNVNATILARAAKKGVPLTGELKTAADFAKAFPRLSREPIGAPASGGLFEPLVYGGVGAATTGGAGAVAAAVPIIGKPIARNLMTTIPKVGKAPSEFLSNYIVQRSIFGAGLQGYQGQAKDLQQKMDDIKSSSLSNREKRKQLVLTKSEMNQLFSDAGKDLNRQELRELRSSIKR